MTSAFVSELKSEDLVDEFVTLAEDAVVAAFPEIEEEISATSISQTSGDN